MKYAAAIVAMLVMGLQDPPKKQDKVSLVPYRSNQPGAKVGAGWEEAAAESPAQLEIRQKLAAKKLTVDWGNGETLESATNYLKDAVGGLNLVIDSSTDSGAAVDLRLTGVSAASLLDLMCQMTNTKWVVADDHVRVLSMDRYRQQYATLRTYDLRDLLFSVRDFPGYTLTPVDDGGPSGAIFGDTEASNPVSEEYISDLIKQTISPESWDYDTIQVMSGVMFVRTLPETHAQIEKFVQKMRQRSQIQVRTEVRVVAVTESVLADVCKNGPALDAAAVAALESSGTLLGAAELMCFNSQRTHVTKANVQTYTSSYDAAVGSAAVALQPKQSRIYDGMMLDVRPVAGADRRSVTLELHFEMNDVKGFKTTAAPGGEIKEPDILNYKLVTTIAVPSDESVIVGALGDYISSVEGAPRLRSVLVVRSTILGLEQK